MTRTDRPTDRLLCATVGSPQFDAGQEVTGTTVKLDAPMGTDSTALINGVFKTITTRHQVITAMEEYENKSFEELRVEDYLANRKGPKVTGTHTTTGLAETQWPSPTPVAIENSETHAADIWLVEEPSTSTTDRPTDRSLCATVGDPHFDARQEVTGTTVKLDAPMGIDSSTSLVNGVCKTITTRHQVITAMEEYENKSFEELRLEDYLANRKGPNVTGTDRTATQGHQGLLFGEKTSKPRYLNTKGNDKMLPQLEESCCDDTIPVKIPHKRRLTSTRRRRLRTNTNAETSHKLSSIQFISDTHVKSTTSTGNTDFYTATNKSRVCYPPHLANFNLSWPYGLCSSLKGTVFIADTYHHRILRVSEGNFIQETRKELDGKLFSYPIGIGCNVGLNEIVVVADSGNGCVCIFDQAGKQLQEITQNLCRPHGVAIRSTNVLVTDITKRSLKKYSYCFGGRVVQTYSEPGYGIADSMLQQPSYVEWSNDSRMIFVSDTAGRCVKIFDNQSGRVVKTLEPFDLPHGLSIDPEQRTLIVADFGRSCVDAVDLRMGRVVSHIAGLNMGLIGPTDVAYHAPSRQVLVLDTTRNRLLEFPLHPMSVLETSDFISTRIPMQLRPENNWMETITPSIVFE